MGCGLWVGLSKVIDSSEVLCTTSNYCIVCSMSSVEGVSTISGTPGPFIQCNREAFALPRSSGTYIHVSEDPRQRRLRYQYLFLS